jgi:hypothetical protein
MIFMPSPLEDEVAAGSSKNVTLTFKPTTQKSEEQKLSLKIVDGLDLDVKCLGIVNESKCVFVEKIIDFGSVAVGLKAKDQMVHLKNLMRSTAVYHVECSSPELTVSQLKGKILGDSKVPFTVGFISHVEKEFSSEITVHIRGGKPLKIPVKARAKIPQLAIEEPEINFGGITQGDSKVLPFTIHNHSDITARLVLDIREYPEFELILPPPNPNDDVTSEIMVPLSDEHKF